MANPRRGPRHPAPRLRNGVLRVGPISETRESSIPPPILRTILAFWPNQAHGVRQTASCSAFRAMRRRAIADVTAKRNRRNEPGSPKKRNTPTMHTTRATRAHRIQRTSARYRNGHRSVTRCKDPSPALRGRTACLTRWAWPGEAMRNAAMAHLRPGQRTMHTCLNMGNHKCPWPLRQNDMHAKMRCPQQQSTRTTIADASCPEPWAVVGRRRASAPSPAPTTTRRETP